MTNASYFRAEMPATDVWIFQDPVTPDGSHVSSHVLRGPGALRTLSDLACWGNEHHGARVAGIAADASLPPREQVEQLLRESVAELQHPRPDMAPRFWPVPDSWKVDFTWSGTGYLLAAQRVSRLLLSLDADALEAFPVQTPATDEPFVILKIKHAIDCIDEAASELVQRFDPVKRPKRAGDYSLVRGMRLQTSRIPPERKIFYTQGYEALIVSDEIKGRMEAAAVTGLIYTAVTVAAG